MKCRAWEELLQRQLDGDPSQALQRHLRDCPHCAAEGRTLARFLTGVARMRSPTPPSELTNRLTRSLIAEAKGRKPAPWRFRVFALAGLAAAAALFLVVTLLAILSGGAGPDEPEMPSIAQQPDAPPPPFRDSVSQVGDAFAALTRDATGEAFEPTKDLLPVMKSAAEPLTSLPPPVEPQLDKPMREAADSVANGLSPVTDSALRAVSLFFRDVPGGKGERPKDKPG